MTLVLPVDEFYLESLSTPQFYLNGILSGRFILRTDLSIYDVIRDRITSFAIPKKNPNSRKKEYMKYEIFLHSPYDFRRKIYLHTFVWMYYNKKLVPEGCSVVHKDENIYNNYYENLRLDLPKIEDEDFYNPNIPDEEWILKQILNDRFEIVENGNGIKDNKRGGKISRPGRFTDNDRNGMNYKKKLEYVITSGIPYPRRKKFMYYRVLWMIHHRQMIPKGYDIHHKDGDRWNNSIVNLEAMSKSEHAKHHAAFKNNSKLNHMKYETCFKKEKICSICKRLLPYNQFHKKNYNYDSIIKRSPACKQCESLSASNQRDKIYKFPDGVLTDQIIMDIRFKFHIANWTINNLLLKYRTIDLTKEILHDILAGITYTHINLMHGVSNTVHRRKGEITKIEENHIRLAKLQGDFTLDELCKMYGRDEDTIKSILVNSENDESICIL